MTAVLVAGVVLAGCSMYAPLQVAPSNRPTTETLAGATVTGRSCQHSVFGIGFGRGNTAREALDRAKAAGGTLTLTDVTVDRWMFFFFPYGQNCTIVRGSPVQG